MNVSNLANLFHQNTVFQQHPMGQKLIQQPITDTLNRLSDNMLVVHDRAKSMKARFDTFELSAEAAKRKESSGLEEMPEELLHFYLNQCKVGAYLSQQQETSLIEYRDQLTAFDQSIQEYQDMLDGKAVLPEQMKREDVALLLETTKMAREQFLQQGAEELNRISREGPTPKEFLGSAYSMIADEAVNDQDNSRWQIDSSAGDIYGQIDHALAAAHKMTSTFQDGASSILAELKRRGCIEEGEEVRFEEQTVNGGAVERESLFQSIYDGIWETFKQCISNKVE